MGAAVCVQGAWRVCRSMSGVQQNGGRQGLGASRPEAAAAGPMTAGQRQPPALPCAAAGAVGGCPPVPPVGAGKEGAVRALAGLGLGVVGAVREGAVSWSAREKWVQPWAASLAGQGHAEVNVWVCMRCRSSQSRRRYCSGGSERPAALRRVLRRRLPRRAAHQLLLLLRGRRRLPLQLSLLVTPLCRLRALHGARHAPVLSAALAAIRRADGGRGGGKHSAVSAPPDEPGAARQRAQRRCAAGRRR